MNGPLETSRRFAVALSFPGEHRKFVLNVATALAEQLGKDRVFYDDWHGAEFRGQSADLKLKSIYREQSEYVIPFFSQHYKKTWCQIEWDAIRAMLVERQNDNAVLPVHMDKSQIDGWEITSLGIIRGRKTGREIAREILEHYRRWTAGEYSDQSSRRDLTTTEATGSHLVTPMDSEQQADIQAETPPQKNGQISVDRVSSADAASADDRLRVVFYVPGGQESQNWVVELWEMLIATDDSHPLKRGCELLGPVIGKKKLNPILRQFEMARTLLIVALDSNILNDAENPTWVDRTLAGVWDGSPPPPWIVGLVGDGTAPECAFQVRDRGAHAAFALSRFVDPDWVWSSIDDLTRGISLLSTLSFTRPWGVASKRKFPKRLAVTGADEDVREIYAPVESISMRLTGKPPLLITGASPDDLQKRLPDLRTAEAVILRVRGNLDDGNGKQSSTDAWAVGSTAAAFLTGVKSKTFCVAKRQERPALWPTQWGDFAHYDYNCEVDLALRLYEWLLVADNGDIIK